MYADDPVTLPSIGSMMEKPAAASGVAARQATRPPPPKYARLRRQEGTGVKRTQGITGHAQSRAVSRDREASTTGIRKVRSQKNAWDSLQSPAAGLEPKQRTCHAPHTQRDPVPCAWTSEHPTEPAVRLNHVPRTGSPPFRGRNSVARRFLFFAAF